MQSRTESKNSGHFINFDLSLQGCLANLDVGGDTSHPIKNALVPSKHVSDGCGGKYQKTEKIEKSTKFLALTDDRKSKTKILHT